VGRMSCYLFALSTLMRWSAFWPVRSAEIARRFDCKLEAQFLRLLHGLVHVSKAGIRLPSQRIVLGRLRDLR